MAEHESQARASPDSPTPIRVMATGVFDLLHLGHLHFLRQARALGSELVVVVARDVTAERFKHRPIVPERLRVQMVGALKPVDIAVLGDEQDYYKVVETFRPDLIALGYDQHWNEERLASDLQARGLHPKIVRLPVLQHDLHATRRIIGRILSLYDIDGERRDPSGAEPSEHSAQSLEELFEGPKEVR